MAGRYNGTPGLSDDQGGMLWSVKYAPTSSKLVAGQNGPKSPANKLRHWLENWCVCISVWVGVGMSLNERA